MEDASTETSLSRGSTVLVTAPTREWKRNRLARPARAMISGLDCGDVNLIAPGDDELVSTFADNKQLAQAIKSYGVVLCIIIGKERSLSHPFVSHCPCDVGMHACMTEREQCTPLQDPSTILPLRNAEHPPLF